MEMVHFLATTSFNIFYFAEKYVLFDISQCLYVQSYSLCFIKYQFSTGCNVFFFTKGVVEKVCATMIRTTSTRFPKLLNTF